MIGIVPSISKTYEVFGDFNCDNLVEGKLYSNPTTGQLFYYSLIEKRPNPNTGYFPVWDGKQTYVTQFANKKFMDTDVTKVDLDSIASSFSKEMADNIVYQQRRASASMLKPVISDRDNFFAQCIKGTINALNISMVDLIDIGAPKYNSSLLQNYYAALNKIPFMRIERWYLWLDILEVYYVLTVMKDGKKIIRFNGKDGSFDTGIVKYDAILKTKSDTLKKIIKIIIVKENISESSLRSPSVDDYTVNNMFTNINGDKQLSAQLFSRFIHMTDLSYNVDIYDRKGKLLFEYKE